MSLREISGKVAVVWGQSQEGVGGRGPQPLTCVAPQKAWKVLGERGGNAAAKPESCLYPQLPRPRQTWAGREQVVENKSDSLKLWGSLTPFLLLKRQLPHPSSQPGCSLRPPRSQQPQVGGGGIRWAGICSSHQERGLSSMSRPRGRDLEGRRLRSPTAKLLSGRMVGGRRGTGVIISCLSLRLCATLGPGGLGGSIGISEVPFQIACCFRPLEGQQKMLIGPRS